MSSVYSFFHILPEHKHTCLPAMAILFDLPKTERKKSRSPNELSAILVRITNTELELKWLPLPTIYDSVSMNNSVGHTHLHSHLQNGDELLFVPKKNVFGPICGNTYVYE